MLKITSLTLSIALAVAASSAYAQDVTTIGGHQYAENQFNLTSPDACLTDHHHAANLVFVVDINGDNLLFEPDPGGCAFGLLTFMPLGGATGSTPTDFFTIDLFLTGLGRKFDKDFSSTVPTLVEDSDVEFGGYAYIDTTFRPSIIPDVILDVQNSSGGVVPIRGMPFSTLDTPPTDPQAAADERIYPMRLFLGALSRILVRLAEIVGFEIVPILKTLVDDVAQNTADGQSIEDATRNAVENNPDADALKNSKTARDILDEAEKAAQEDLDASDNPRRQAKARQQLRAIRAMRAALGI